MLFIIANQLKNFSPTQNYKYIFWVWECPVLQKNKLTPKGALFLIVRTLLGFIINLTGRGVRCSNTSKLILSKQLGFLNLVLKYLNKTGPTYLNKVNLKLLLQGNHCTAHCPQKE